MEHDGEWLEVSTKTVDSKVHPYPKAAIRPGDQDYFQVVPNATVDIFSYTPSMSNLKFSTAASAFPREVWDSNHFQPKWFQADRCYGLQSQRILGDAIVPRCWKTALLWTAGGACNSWKLKRTEVGYAMIMLKMIKCFSTFQSCRPLNMMIPVGEPSIQTLVAIPGAHSTHLGIQHQQVEVGTSHQMLARQVVPSEAQYFKVVR